MKKVLLSAAMATAFFGMTAAHAADTLENGETVTVDASRGTIFRGAANAR